MKKELHNIAPIYDENSRILILGSFPSVKSRADCFFYQHPRNRFWQVMAMVLDETTPESIEEKTKMLLKHGVALWDVIESCEIEGSADSTITNVVPNKLETILQAAQIEKIYLNGGKAYDLYRRFFKDKIQLPAEKLPSTSPANASWSLQRLTEKWRQINSDLHELN